MVALSPEAENVLKQARSWPAETRIALARRLLETLDEGTALRGGHQGPSSKQVLGLWNAAGVPPTDEECEQILEEELRRKHAP